MTELLGNMTGDFADSCNECKTILPLQILQNGAGFYLGTICHNHSQYNLPVVEGVHIPWIVSSQQKHGTRKTKYFYHLATAQRALAKVLATGKHPSLRSKQAERNELRARFLRLAEHDPENNGDWRTGFFFFGKFSEAVAWFDETYPSIRG
jgi:hypothetical protein